MKKGVFVFILFSIFLVSFAVAQDETIDDKAYDCLKERFNQTECDGLSTEGKIFALLTLGKCEDEIREDSNYKSDIKLTSQAILALDKVGIDTDDPVEWLWEQNKTPTDMVWYLQIDSSKATSCSISYGSTTSTINIGDDKKIDSNAGACLTRASGNYWLQINANCYDEEFEITCGQSTDSLTFKTNLLFKRPNENTIHVSSVTHSEDGGGTTEEKVSIQCFKKGNNCDFEGTLWAALILDYIDSKEDLSPIEFYLTTSYDLHPEFLPQSFLYSLTDLDKFEDELIQSQNNDGSWKKGDNRYYDTALALLSIPSESVSWKNAVSWLEEKQMENGCWNENSFLDTAFTLYSVWPRGVSISGVDGGTTTGGESCTDAGYFCMSGINCGGSILNAYDCDGFKKCCDKEQSLETCSDLKGDICNSNQQCTGGDSENTFDLDSGQTCCVGGACEEKATVSFTCESSGGICRIGDCNSNEEISSETCEYNDKCCIEKTTKEKNYLWIWILILLILIALAAIAIVKKDKVREYWFRLKSKFKKTPPSPPARGRPGRPIRRSVTPAATQRRLMQGKAPPTRQSVVKRPSRIARPSSKAPSEINDVLKKLKDMGK